MSSSSESIVDSEVSSPYQSDGEVQCSFTKRYSSTGSEESVKDGLDFGDTFSPTEKTDIQNDVMRRKEDGTDWINIFPRGAEKNLHPVILARIEVISRGKMSFVYISSGLMNVLKTTHKVPVPKCVINDVCIVPHGAPMKVLTFVRNHRRLDKFCEYNSCLSRVVNTTLRKDAVDNIHIVHGVIEEEEWKSESLFKTKIENLETSARHLAIPYSLDNSESRCVAIIQSFLKMIYSCTDVADIYESGARQTVASNFVMTTAYYKALDVLQTYRHVTITGGSGEGKTTMGHMLCQEYQTKGYETFFYDSYNQADITLISEVRVPFLLVIDNMFDDCHVLQLQSFLTAFEQHVKSRDVILILVCHLYDLKQAHKHFETYLLTEDTTVDITGISSRNPGSTRCERYQLMKVLNTNLSTAEMIKISNLSLNTMGFPKICARYQTEQHPEPIRYFTYPHGYFQSLFSTLLKKGRKRMAALTLLIMNGGRIEFENLRSGHCQHLNHILYKLQNMFNLKSRENILQELEFLSGTFLKNENGVISFQSPVMFDAYVFVINVHHPKMLRNHCTFRFPKNANRALSSSNNEILISKENLYYLLHDLGNSLLKRQFRMLVNNPLLATNESVDILVNILQEDLQQVISSVDVRGRGNFLYWACQSDNSYLVEMVNKHSSMEDIRAALLCCIHSKQASVFVYLWERMKVRRTQCCDVNQQDEHGKTYLLSSVEKDDVVTVELLLQEGSNPLIPDFMGNTSLHIAGGQGNPNIVKLLLSVMGNNVNIKDGESRTPVMLAAAGGHWEAFRLLANVKGCDLTCLDIYGDSVLHLACLSGSTKIVKDLLSDSSVDINATGKHGRVPLMVAAYEGHGDVFELLTKAKGVIMPEYAGIISRDTETTITGCTHLRTSDTDSGLLHRVARNGHMGLLEFLLSESKTGINTKGNCGRTPLMEAALTGHKGVFDFLINKGASLLLLDDNDCTILHLACEGGNTELIKSLQEQTSYINTKDRFGKTPIMHALEKGQHEAFEILVDNSDLSAHDVYGNTLLHLACMGGSLSNAEHLLMKRSFDIDLPNKHGKTPVMIAAYHACADICHMLIDKGCALDKTNCVDNTILGLAVQSGNVQSFADILDYSRISVNHRYKNGKTLAMIAAVNGKTDVLKFLIGNGCDLTMTDDDQNNVLHLACSAGEQEVVETIVQENIDLNSCGKHGRTALMMAAERGCTDICDLLTDEVCSFHSRDDYGNTILHIACLGGYRESVEYILSQRDVDINIRGQDGKTAVMFVVETGQSETFEHFVMKGCDLDISDDKGNSLLHAACIGGSVNIVKYLLINGSFDLNSGGHLNRTPAMLAAFNGHLNLLIYLIQKECDLSLLDAEGNTVFHIACQGGHIKVCDFLLYLGIFALNVTGKCLRTPAMVAAYMCHTSVFELLAEAGCDLTAEDKHGNRMIHMACLGGSCQVVEKLLSKGFNPDQKGRFQRTPVMLAACRGHSEAYYLLVKEHSDLSGTDSFGNNLLHMACRGGNVDIVEHVLSLGTFNLDSAGQYGRTPVMIAAGKGHQEVVDLLIEHGCDLTQVDDDGNNILHVACLGGKSSVVKYLLGCKIIDIRQKNNSNLSPKNLARYSGYDDISCLLQRQEHFRTLG